MELLLRYILYVYAGARYQYYAIRTMVNKLWYHCQVRLYNTGAFQFGSSAWWVYCTPCNHSILAPAPTPSTGVPRALSNLNWIAVRKVVIFSKILRSIQTASPIRRVFNKQAVLGAKCAVRARSI